MFETAEILSTFHNQMNRRPRSFVLKHVFKDVSKMEENRKCLSETEDHYGVPWCFYIDKRKGSMCVYLWCKAPENEEQWSIDTEIECHVSHPSGSSVSKTTSYCFTESVGYGWEKFMNWEKIKEKYVFNDELVVELRVKITKMAGFEVYLRRFDNRECSDVALLVDGKKFYVSKLYLASQSSYFKSMFLGKFNEAGKSEIELTEIHKYDLQKYLEMLYGEDALNDETVEGILHLADMYDTKNLIEKREKYLLEISTESLKQKLEIAVTYNLVKLKKKCISDIKTIDDVRSVISGGVRDMDHDILADLLEKTLALAP